MRISKQAASDMAYEALKSKYDKLNEQYDAVNLDFETVALATVPDIVLQAFKLHPGYIDSTVGYYQIFADDEVKDHRSFYSIKDIPCCGRQVKVSAEDFRRLIASDVAYNKAKDELKQNRAELETAILQLGTYKRVAATIPELIPFLPTSDSVALAPDMSHVRQILGTK